MSTPGSVDALALVPAHNEAERVGATVSALRKLPGVAEVLVVSDGSTDATAARALEVGAHCLDLPRNIGKGGALNAGLAALTGRVAEGLSPEPVALLLADADLGDSAARLDALLAPVLAGEADLVIADLPPQPGSGGFGVAMTLDAWAGGLRVVEVPLDLRHRPTGRTIGGIVHRGRQAGSIARELVRHRVWSPPA